MPQRQRHRGPHPEDAHLFADDQIERLRDAAGDLSFLLTRNYARDASLKVVGNHYQLDVRQRRAILCCACSDASLEHRQNAQVPLAALRGETVAVDGYNLLITTESLLGGGVLLRGRDGCLRDLASVHGSYRRVEETQAALLLIGQTLAQLGVGECHWYFDAPVSNSGRLKSAMNALAKEEGWPWHIELAQQVDQRLAQTPHIAVTSDGWVLDRVGRWANVLEEILQWRLAALPEALRDGLGIIPRAVLDFREEAVRLVAEKALQKDPVTAVLGCLRVERSTEEVVAEMRGAP